jgi:hypothetical protein
LRFLTLNNPAATWGIDLFHAVLTDNYSWVKSLAVDRASRRVAASSGDSMHIKVLELAEIDRTRSASGVDLLQESSIATGLRIEGTEAVSRVSR